MKGWLVVGGLGISLASLAGAAPELNSASSRPADLGSVASAEPKVITLPMDERIAATVTLLAPSFKEGRSTPVFNNYRPLILFSGEKEVLSCALKIPTPPEMLEPGQTLELALSCALPFKVMEGQLEFTMFEGGKKIGHGVLRER